jgi:hypothetical protein
MGFLHWKPREAFFERHYHREEFVYEAKRAGVQLVALQNGIIARVYLVYIFRPALKPMRERCPLPDKRFVWAHNGKPFY